MSAEHLEPREPEPEPSMYVVACRDDDTGVTTYSGPYATYADAVAALPELTLAEFVPGLDPPRRMTLRIGPLHQGPDPYADLGDLDD